MRVSPRSKSGAKIATSLEETIENIFASRDHKHWLEQLKKADLPHGIVRGIAQVLAHPQVAARKLIREAESPVGKVPVIANALKMSASEARYDRIPALGENNAAILSELGYDAAAIEGFSAIKSFDRRSFHQQLIEDFAICPLALSICCVKKNRRFIPTLVPETDYA